jgi:hypothetical protein
MGVVQKALVALRDRPALLVLTLAAVNLINVADFCLTLDVLNMGGGEATLLCAGCLDSTEPGPAHSSGGSAAGEWNRVALQEISPGSPGSSTGGDGLLLVLAYHVFGLAFLR